MVLNFFPERYCLVRVWNVKSREESIIKFAILSITSTQSLVAGNTNCVVIGKYFLREIIKYQ